ncbi:helix-turn-helix domain-containing protein [Enemella evansiae]|uniref:helix-turn-helix domain-containing protein n=1 Tax=Enemella evansiae TaxID=2016499 RepID=UPI000B9636EC|nr:MerR family transcriptional regulator [Enemella evansiae]OYO07678.1 MerR family transcriptional regulator [Enemella evansiae]TDO85933.1 DNA-binding transcriptional MerR regulator [Enemella evansiae]
MLTIGQLAAYAEVSVRTVRHYHQIGLLPEPDRDASGYRRYAAADLVALVRIRTLADSGVPLSRIAELIDAPQAELDQAVTEIDRELRVRITELQQTRKRLARLREGGELVLPPNAVRLFERMREIGVDEDAVRIERESWILMRAVHPDGLDDWADRQLRALEDPLGQRLYPLMTACRSWAADDPRLEEVIELSVELTQRHFPPELANDPRWQINDQVGIDMVNTHSLGDSPAWQRVSREVAARLKEHGYG